MCLSIICKVDFPTNNFIESKLSEQFKKNHSTRNTLLRIWTKDFNVEAIYMALLKAFDIIDQLLKAK